MISEVPCMAIDHASIFANSSPLHDEMLAQRIGLLPILCDDLDKLVEPHNCKCETSTDNLPGCNRCSARFVCDVTNNTNGVILVTSKDVQYNMYGPPGVNFRVATPDAHDTLLTKLAPKQKLQFIAIAFKGIAKEHAKWQPVSVASFFREPVVKLRPDLLRQMTERQRDRLVASCPSRVFRRHATKLVDIEDALACTSCGECIDLCANMGTLADAEANPDVTVVSHANIDRNAPFEKAVEISEVPDRFHFHVESAGQLAAWQVVVAALRNLRHKVNFFTQALKAETTEDLRQKQRK
ncbi:MAG: hypothetical protein MHM6MM_007416 [Cercozoa sp. M6MM]